ncbi:hypothetical protein ACV1BL_02570 [Serratia marcescens]
MSDERIKRMRIKSAQELAGDEPMLIREYLSTFPLSMLGRILISLNITIANSNFPQVANNAPALIDYICLGVASDKIKSPFDKINKLVKDVESDVFSDGCIVWLKNDIEACHYFWWSLMQLEWRGVFKLLRADNIHRYSDVGGKQQAQYVSDTFCLPRVVGGHKERYKSIFTLLSLLPFKNTEINLLISHLSCNYKRDKEIWVESVKVV